MRWRFGGILVVVCLLALAAGSATASAAPVTVDFESGASPGQAITNQYAIHAGVPEGPTFSAPSNANFPSFGCGPGHLSTLAAHSGVNSVAFDGCAGGEFFPSAGFFSIGYTTDSVTFWVWDNVGAQVVSTSFDAHHSRIAQVVTQVPAHQWTQVALSSASFNIAFVAVEDGNPNANSSSPTGVQETTGDAGGEVFLDDLTYEPPATPPNASFVIGANPAATSTVEGGQAHVTIPITWFNNPNPSAYPVSLAATTPSGVTASFSPDPTSTGSSTLTLDVAKTAPVGQGTVVVTATQGSETEQVTIPFGVSAPFDIVNPGAITVQSCSTRQVPLTVATPDPFGQPITISVAASNANAQGIAISQLSGPSGPGTVYDPGDAAVTVSPQNGQATATLTLSAGTPSAAPTSAVFGVYVSSSGYNGQDNFGTLRIGPSDISAVLGALGPVHTPQALAPGSTITVTGHGFCPDAKVSFGNAQAVATPTSVTPTSLSVKLPRLATTGPVTVSSGSPPLSSAPSSQTLTVDSYRNTNGWAFANYTPSGFDLNQLTDVFGVGQVFFSINPCWPFATCSIPLFPTPTAGILLGIADATLANSTGGGACMGFSLSTQRILENEVNFAEFAPHGNTIASVDSPGGPSAFARRYINTEALFQFGQQFIVPVTTQIAGADLTPTAQQIQTIRGRVSNVLAAGRYPLIVLRDHGGGGHVVIAYDIEDNGPNDFYIDVYDSNDPFAGQETSDGGLHQSNVESSRVHVMPDGTWSLPSTNFSGGQDGLEVIDPKTIPLQETMPNALPGGLYFGSAGPIGADGGAPASAPSSRTVQLTGPGGRTLFAGGRLNTNPHTRLAAAPFAPLVGSPAARREIFSLAPGATNFTQSVVGTGSGPESYTLLAAGTVARIDTRAQHGVSDRLLLHPSDGAIGLTTAAAHAPLTLTFTGPAAGAQRTAEVSTTSYRAGGDTLVFGGRRTDATFLHHGPATTFSLRLASLLRNGTSASFSSGPLRIGAGQVARVTGIRWSDLAGSSLRIRIGRHTLLVHNRLRTAVLGRITRVHVVAVRGRLHASIAARITRLPAGSAVAAVWLIRRAGHVIASHAVALALTQRRPTLTWTVNAPKRGRYQLVARLTVLEPKLGVGVESSTSSRATSFSRR